MKLLLAIRPKGTRIEIKRGFSEHFHEDSTYNPEGGHLYETTNSKTDSPSP